MVTRRWGLAQDKMEWIPLPDSTAEISTSPVTWADYERFAQATGRLIQPPGSPLQPVTGVSAGEARAFAEWLSQRERQHYRLPMLDEICALAHQAPPVRRLWPCLSGGKHRLWRGAQNCLSEWLECSPDLPSGYDHLNCIVHPAWLSNNHGIVPHAALADGGRGFVTFRLVRS